ncbi:MAG: CoA protein activase [Actinobacteria bacterium]|nr:CoA protein activase [Actinomycetota bacterium]
MKISAPRMGNLHLIIRDLADRFDLDYIEPPVFDEDTLKIGAALAPETACLPLKAVLGTFIKLLESGCETLLMGGGSGPCRFGYYGEILDRVLTREGYEFNLIIIDPPSTSVREFHNGIRKALPRDRYRLSKVARELLLALRKVGLYDEIEKWAMAIRGIELEKGIVDHTVIHANEIAAGAYSKREIASARAEIQNLFNRIPTDDPSDHLKIGLVGEIFIVLEPFFNFDIDRWLGKRGVIVERSVHITDTVWLSSKNPVFGHSEHEIARAAAPYLSCEVGGDGLLTVGGTVIFAQNNFDAVVHFLPFTCMPEVIAKTVLARVSRELSIPVLSLTIDEQTGKAGVETRLEALLDLAMSTRQRREQHQPDLIPAI